MEILKENLPLLLPIIFLEIGLMIYSINHILKHDKYRFGNRTIWLLIVIFIQIIGPIIYLTVGKEEQ